MYTLLEAQNLVEKQIQTLSIPDTPPELYEPVRYILSLGGEADQARSCNPRLRSV